jgi:hypothetical protein
MYGREYRLVIWTETTGWYYVDFLTDSLFFFSVSFLTSFFPLQYKTASNREAYRAGIVPVQ